ncbi:MAG: hypothetical protein HQK78_11290 [Desulfobacterales bacterium]|nr:hypothetical protein [Desulfobacterales bacterium]
MSLVLVTVNKGHIHNVKFYDNVSLALEEFATYVKSMNLNEADAAVYDSDGVIANAKDILKISQQSIDEAVKEIIDAKKKEIIYIIANPVHSLGFLNIGIYEPIGYKDPIEALIALEKLRNKQGIHIKLYRAELVDSPVMKRDRLEKDNIKKNRVDFEYPIVEEYLS